VQGLYNIDPGWGGAHLTMTSFQAESADSAKKKFKNFHGELHKKTEWHPTTFEAETKSNGVVRLGIKSENLDFMIGSLSKAGWESPTTKGNWHVTLADLTHKSFSSNDEAYKTVTHWFTNLGWAVVLVHCYKGENGEIRFHREGGFTLNEWTNSVTV
jgi:hypothetical protein